MKKNILIIILTISLLVFFTTSCNSDDTNFIEDSIKDNPSTQVIPQPDDELITVEASYPLLSLNDLISESNIIIIGRVTEILPSQTDTNERPGQEIIYTDVIIQIDEYLYGQSKTDKIAVRVRGGRVGNTAMIVSNSPIFYLEEEVCVFLRYTEQNLIPPIGFNSTNYYKVTADQLGKGQYKDNKMKREVGDDITISQIKQSISSTQNS